MRTMVISAALGWSLLVQPALAQPSQPPQAEKLVESALQANDEKRFLEAGDMLVQAGDLYQAAGQTESALQLYYYAVNAYLKESGEHKRECEDRALAVLEKDAPLREQSGDVKGLVESRFTQTEILIGKKKYVEAEAACSKAYQTSLQLPQNSPVRYATSKEMAQVLDILHRWDQAAVVYQKTIELAKLSAPADIPGMQLTLGSIYQLQGNPELSEQYYKAGIEGYAKAGDKPEWTKANFDLANKWMREGRYQEAVELWGRLATEGKPQQKALEATVQQALAYRGLGDYKKAYDILTVSRTQITDPATLGRLDAVRVQVQAKGGQTKEARKLLSSAAFPDDLTRASVAADAELTSEAQSYYEAYLDSVEGIDKIRALNSYAVKLMEWGDAPKAQQRLQQALELAGPEHDTMRPTLLTNLGESYLKQGQATLALPHFLAALEAFGEQANPTSLATLLNNIAACYEHEGNLPESLKYLERGVKIADTIPGSPAIKPTLNNALGYYYVQLGRPQDGIAYYQRALAQHRITRNPIGIRTVLYNLGAAQIWAGLKNEGYDSITEALDLAQRNHDEELEARICLFLADQREPAFRQKMIAAADSLLPRLHNITLKASLLNQKALYEYDREHYKEARQLSEESLALYPEGSSASGAFEARRLLLRTALAHKDSDQARTYVPGLLQDLETRIWGLSSGPARSLVAREGGFLQQYSLALIEAGQAGEAFAVEEKWRSLGLAALTRDLPLTSAHVEPSLLLERERLAGMIRESRAAKDAQAKENLESLLLSYRGVLDKIEREHLAAGLVTKIASTTAEEVQQSLRPDEALLEFVGGPNETKVLVVDREGIEVYSAGSTQEVAELAERVFRGTKTLTSERRLQKDYETLGQTLLQGALPRLTGKTKLVIVPSEGLYSLPFAALRLDDQWLIDRFEITMANSASAWLTARKTTTRGHGMLAGALGDFGGRGSKLVPLPATEDEVAKIKSLYPQAEVVLKDQLVVDAVKQESKDKKQLHLATHGKFDSKEPLLSALYFADRQVTAADIFGWDLDADLAVLSACESGEFSKDNTYLGLTSAFQYAGARNLVVSYWPVSDEGTALWMSAFYTELSQGRPPSQAVRAAHQATRATYSHPYYWAPFVSWGDGL